MIEKQKVKELLGPVTEREMITIVDVLVNSGNQIRIVLDSLKGVSIDQCVEISRLFEATFDRETEDYELEVSSYGISQPFIIPLHYQKNLHKNIEVLLKTGKSIKGILKKVEQNNSELEYIELLTKKKVQLEGKKRKSEVEEIIRLGNEEIQKTKLILDF